MLWAALFSLTDISPRRCTDAACGFAATSFQYSATLKAPNGQPGSTSLDMYWSFSKDNDEIAIGVDAHGTNGWVAIGISASGGMMGADVWRLSADPGTGELVLADMFVEDWVTPRLDKHQNLKLMSARQANGRTSFWFTRKVRPCDGGGLRHADNVSALPEDFDILGVGGDANKHGHLIWAMGSSHSFYQHAGSPEMRGRLAHSWIPGSAAGRGDIFGADAQPAAPRAAGSGCAKAGSVAASASTGANLMKHRLVNDPFEVDNTKSTVLVQTYWEPPSGTWLVTDIRWVRDQALKEWHHHTLIYGCSSAEAATSKPIERRSDSCRELLFVKDVGDGVKKGILIGEGSDIKGFRVEIHYDGLWTMQAPMTDTGTGYELTLAPDDGSRVKSSSLTLGTLSMDIPSGQRRGEETAHFWGSCTVPDTVPAEGLTVFYSIFHMHLAGRSIHTTHLRKNELTGGYYELEELGRHNFYDWNFQGAGGFPPKGGATLLPGDILVTHCWFDSTNDVNRNKHGGIDIEAGTRTTFGEGTMDEMCFNFIQYYPRVPGFTTCIQGSGQGNPLDEQPFTRNSSKSGEVDQFICGSDRGALCSNLAACFQDKGAPNSLESAGCDPGTGTVTNPQQCAGFNVAAAAARAAARGGDGGEGGGGTLAKVFAQGGGGGGGTFYNTGGGGGGTLYNTLVDTICPQCYPHSACGKESSLVDYVARTKTGRTCGTGDAAAETASLKPEAYWMGPSAEINVSTQIDVQIDGCGGDSDDGGDTILIVGVAAGAVVAVLAVLALGLYMRSLARKASPPPVKSVDESVAA